MEQGFSTFPLGLEEWFFYLYHLKNLVVGSRWQDTRTDGENLVVLDLFRSGVGSSSMIFDLSPLSPGLVFREGEFFSFPSSRFSRVSSNSKTKSSQQFRGVQKPLTLFARAHGEGGRISDLRLKENWGRILELEVVRQEEGRGSASVSFRLEFVAIPRRVNLSAFAEEKEIHWRKPHILEPQKDFSSSVYGSFNLNPSPSAFPVPDSSSGVPFVDSSASPRSHSLDSLQISPSSSSSVLLLGVFEKWKERIEREEVPFGVSSSHPPSLSGGAMIPPPSSLRALEKKKRALESMNRDHRTLIEQLDLLRTLGYWMKAHPHCNPSGDQLVGLRPEVYSPQRSWSQNLEAVFGEIKKREHKLGGQLGRIQFLEGEIRDLESAIRDGRGDLLSTSVLSPMLNSPLRKSVKRGKGERDSELRVRKKIFPEDPSLEAYMGRSGRDNLELLRRARPWDYWVHIKDEPGAHVVLFRNKGHVVSQKIFEILGDWLIRGDRSSPVSKFPSLGSEKSGRLGKVDVLIVECRYVRPIKGDRLGRVTYQNPRVLTLRLE